MSKKSEITNASYEQFIMINGTEYPSCVEVEYCDEKKSINDTSEIDYCYVKLSVIINDIAYTCKTILTKNQTKKMIDGLNKNMGICYETSFNEDNDIVVKIFHSYLGTPDIYVLKKPLNENDIMSLYKSVLPLRDELTNKIERVSYHADNLSNQFDNMSNSLDSILKHINEKNPKKYLITDDMLGDYYKLDFKMDIENVTKELSIVHNDSKACVWTLPSLKNYYTIRSFYKGTIPKLRDDQIFFTGLLSEYTDKSNIFVKFEHLKNTYTILTRKYEQNVVGIMYKGKNRVAIDFIHYFTDSKNEKLDRPCPQYTVDPEPDNSKDVSDDKNKNRDCDEDNYDQFFLLNFPTNIPDSVYQINELPHFVLVENNKLYLNLNAGLKRNKLIGNGEKIYNYLNFNL
jgi:hypothetical protein